MKILYIQKFNIKFCSWINTTYESTCIQLQTLLQFGLGTNLSRDDLRLVPHIQTKGWNKVRVHHTSITSHRKRIQNQQKKKHSYKPYILRMALFFGSTFQQRKTNSKTNSVLHQEQKRGLSHSFFHYGGCEPSATPFQHYGVLVHRP